MSDDATTVAEPKGQVATFSRERDWDQFHGAKDLAIGVVTEAGELLEEDRVSLSKFSVACGDLAALSGRSLQEGGGEMLLA